MRFRRSVEGPPSAAATREAVGARGAISAPTKPAERAASVAQPARAGLAPPVTRREPTGTRLLATDARETLLLLNEARYRTLERLFGVSREQANLLTAVAVLKFADSAQEKAAKLMRPPSLPSATDAAIAAAAARSMFGLIAGAPARGKPLFGMLVTLALLGGVVRPTVSKSAHELREASHRRLLAFHHRYGYLVAASRRR